MTDHHIVTRDAWIIARKELLEREKALTKLRDQVSRERRALPWVKVEEAYVFEGPTGQETLLDLFDGRSQLIVYHFMFAPDWEAGCKSCSFLADHYERAVVHLQQRDVTLVTVSRAPLAKLQAYAQRLGWTFKWVSSLGCDFNRDFHVSFTPEEAEQGSIYYNYTTSPFFCPEAPGLSVFTRDEHDTIFHTYSCYARGLDRFMGTYHLLDTVPRGRDEASLNGTMSWLRRRDEY